MVHSSSQFSSLYQLYYSEWGFVLYACPHFIVAVQYESRIKSHRRGNSRFSYLLQKCETQYNYTLQWEYETWPESVMGMGQPSICMSPTYRDGNYLVVNRMWDDVRFDSMVSAQYRVRGKGRHRHITWRMSAESHAATACALRIHIYLPIRMLVRTYVHNYCGHWTRICAH